MMTMLIAIMMTTLGQAYDHRVQVPQTLLPVINGTPCGLYMPHALSQAFNVWASHSSTTMKLPIG